MAQPERVSPKHETVMDVSVEQLARVYAKAFIGATAKLPNGEGLVQELKSVVTDVLDRYPQLERTLESSLVSREQKEQVLNRVFGNLASPQVINFLKVVSRHGRLGLLRPIVRQVEKLYQELSGMTDVELRVAAVLDETLLGDLRNRLQKMLGRRPILNVKIDPLLIAGIVVRVGDRVYDGSVRTQLENARHAMIDRATEQIEAKPDRFLLTAS